MLDDAFQHRRVQRLADIVLVSADRWTGDVRLLPAGPWREPLEAVRRATLVVVTRKAAERSHASMRCTNSSPRVAPAIPRVSVRSRARRPRSGATRSRRDATARRRWRARRFARFCRSPIRGRSSQQLEARGAIVDARDFPDHHRVSRARKSSVSRPDSRRAIWSICTLKDAVKLGAAAGLALRRRCGMFLSR